MSLLCTVEERRAGAIIFLVPVSKFLCYNDLRFMKPLRDVLLPPLPLTLDFLIGKRKPCEMMMTTALLRPRTAPEQRQIGEIFTTLSLSLFLSP